MLVREMQSQSSLMRKYPTSMPQFIFKIKLDEIFGPINDFFFLVKMMEGIVATSYSSGDKFYIDPMKLLPLERFLPQPKAPQSAYIQMVGPGMEAYSPNSLLLLYLTF